MEQELYPAVRVMGVDFSHYLKIRKANNIPFLFMSRYYDRRVSVVDA